MQQIKREGASNCPDSKGGQPMADSQAKTEWERENVIRVLIKVNRNQDPELFNLLQQAESKSGTARELMQKAISKAK